MGTDRSMQEVHWAKTKSLMIRTLVIWFVFSFVVHWFADSLNGVAIFGFPLGFYMAAQGALIAFVVLIFWFVRAQNKIDIECGMAEDE
jgi:putative solute:sodium symporter small subunit